MQKISYMGNGITKEFHFSFPYYDNTNIVILKNNNPATDYEIIGTSNGPNADIPFSGGKVVFEVAPKASDSITITRSLPLSRIVDYQPTEKINPTVLNQDLNYMIELMKDFKTELSVFRSQYADFADQESAQILSAKMAATADAIENLGDIASINSSLATLNNRTNNLLDYVVASQSPTAANGYTWYRKYKSGWVEQGGILTGSVSIAPNTEANLGAATLPVAMKDTQYNAFAVGDGYTILMNVSASTNKCVFKFGAYASSLRTLTCVRWFVCGETA